MCPHCQISFLIQYENSELIEYECPECGHRECRRKKVEVLELVRKRKGE